MLIKLPYWRLTEVHPAIHDYESLTTVQMTARVYGAMQKLIEDYNKWIDEVNLTFENYEKERNINFDEFKEDLTKITNDFIQSVDHKISCQDRKIDELYVYLKDNIIVAVQDVVSQMKENGELDEAINNVLTEINETLTNYQNTINSRITEFENSVNVKISSLETNVTNNINSNNTKITGLESEIQSINETLTTHDILVQANSSDVLTLRGDFTNANRVIGELAQDNETNKNNISKLRNEMDNNLNNLLSNLIIRSGTKVITVTNSDGGELFKEAELKTLLGVDEIKAGSIICSVSNGNISACEEVLIGAHLSPVNKRLYVYFKNAINGTIDIQVNYVIFYNKD